MIGIKINFTSLPSLNPVPSIAVADSFSCPVLDKGVVCASSSLFLYHVLYSLKFSVSLLLISQIAKSKNCSMTFFPTYHVFQDLQTRTRIGLGPEKYGLYYLDNGASSSILAVVSLLSSISPLLWHYRLGPTLIGTKTSSTF